ncbi:hypothetical protein C5167_009426 [Papaver somniferum]|uniref:Translocon at the inner envelope membrane of chloroplasts 214 n=1 Tax=Papaver somniferum TaxID=3469 RepID=A0A4Y7K094_PAPSO|nr:hypothetical protein C5167_009426 [Papaver somniferum]
MRFSHKKEKFERKYFLPEEGKLNSENRTKYLFDAVTPDRHHQRIIKESIGIKEIRKEVPQWSYKLITSLDQQDGTILEETAEDHEIRSRKANHVVIFTDTERTNSTTNTNDEVEEVFVLRYAQESDFRRDIIKGSMRAQRRKTGIWELFQTNIHSPLFLDRIYKNFEEETKEKDKKRKKKGEENDRLAVAESWDTVLFGLRVLKEKTKGFLKDSKEKESWTHKKDFFQKKRIKELGKVNPILLVGLRKLYESSENQKISLKENQIVHESSSRIRSMSSTNYSLTEKKTENLADRTSTIKNQIEKIINDKKKTFLIPDRNINPNDTSCNDKRLEAPKSFLRIFQRRSARLIRKRHSFLNFLIEKIYMDTLLYLINIPRINAKFFLDLKKGEINKKSYNAEIKKEERALSNISNKNLHHFCAPVDLSPAYVFYKLSQTQVINKYHIIKKFFGTQGILYSESRHKKLSNFETNGWKNWLNSHYNYQYNLSKITSSQLALQKQRNGVNQSHTISNKASRKLDSYEQKNVFHYKKQNAYYGYDLLSQKYINYREGNDSYISLSPLQVKGSRKIPYNYNTNKPPVFYMPAGIYMSHYLGEDCIVDTDKNPDRKYFDWRIVSFCLRKKIDIEAWANMDTETRMDKNTKTGINYYSIINQIDTKDLSYLAIDKQIKPSSGKNFFLIGWG